MHTIDLTPYGMKIRAEGLIQLDEAKAFSLRYREMLHELSKRGKPFGQYVDLRGFKLGGPDAQALIEKAMEEFKAFGGQRSGMVLDNVVAAMQMRRLSVESNTYDIKRFIDPDTHPNFEQVAMAWVVEGKDPDQK